MEKTVKTLKELMETPELLGEDSKLSKIKSLYTLWYKVNGRFEQSKTAGLFLKNKEGKELYPTLIVYLNSPSALEDFRTNKEIYLMRLETQGLLLHDIVFKLSHTDFYESKIFNIKKESQPISLETLSEEEMDEAKALSKKVSSDLQETVLNAIVWSFRRQKTKHLKN